MGPSCITCFQTTKAKPAPINQPTKRTIPGMRTTQHQSLTSLRIKVNSSFKDPRSDRTLQEDDGNQVKSGRRNKSSRHLEEVSPPTKLKGNFSQKLALSKSLSPQKKKELRLFSFRSPQKLQRRAAIKAENKNANVDTALKAKQIEAICKHSKVALLDAQCQSAIDILKQVPEAEQQLVRMPYLFRLKPSKKISQIMELKIKNMDARNAKIQKMMNNKQNQSAYIPQEYLELADEEAVSLSKVEPASFKKAKKALQTKYSSRSMAVKEFKI